MPDYAIGDLQGCLQPLQRLLDHINYDESIDQLWFAGDLVNRGPHSLEVLRFIKKLSIPARISLGNHDLYLLTRLFGNQSDIDKEDTLNAVLAAPDGIELGHWLRRQSFICHDPELNVVMTHAGIAPIWNLSTAIAYGQELERVLAGQYYLDYLNHLYDNESASWSTNLTGFAKLKLITDYFTRMRFCNRHGELIFSQQTTLAEAPMDSFPWYAVPNRLTIEADIIFGHWAALQGRSASLHIHAIDTGCVYGGQLTAIRLQDKKRFSVIGLRN